MAVKQPKSMLAGHTAGIFADMTLDGPEIGTLVTVVDRAKNLPNRKTMGKQDPYCAMRLGKEAKKTDTDRRGGQTPRWDQELRFTVHDSPDYYRLKVSVFNDDKKTDLIGEAYVNLHDLIKPGGGSNDLWHQLNYKGKYAGEIRMEMTYYDTRPREERPVEKRRHREKAASVASDAASSVSGPRQLGPREVRRRPLPTNPGADTPSPVTVPQSQAPPTPPKIPLSHPVTSHASTPRSEQYMTGAQLQDYNTASPLPSNSYFQPVAQQHYESEPQYQHFNPESQYDQSPDQYPYEQAVPSPRSLPMLTHHSPSHPGIPETWDEPGRRHSENYELNTASTTAHGLPPSLPHASHSAPEVPQYRPYKMDTSPTKFLQYRDSPLRHSVSQQEVPQDFVYEHETYDLPPPPPKHRDSGARNHQSDYSSAAYVPKPLRPTPRRPSVDGRSPLQNIEREFDPSLASTHDSSRHSSYDMYTQSPTGSMHTPDQHGSHDAYFQPSPSSQRVHSRQGSFDPYCEPEPLTSHAHEPQPYYDDQQERSLVVQRQHAVQDRTDVYGRQDSRNVYVQGQQSSPSPYRDGHSGSFDEHPEPNAHIAANPREPSNYPRPQANTPASYASPVQVRPRPQKAVLTQVPGFVPPRKAVSPGPYPADCSRRLSETPFGPDDYDVLNPASSPATNEHTPYETPEQSKESARLREVEKLRDQGPIIGNDGRVIDPSDHLPSDTWAPEPERKQRKPEHVIHIRTKNDIRGHNTPVSSPASIRTTTHRTPLRGSPVSPSPVSNPPSAGRNRLQKSTPTRPLPTQPYQQALPAASHSRESPIPYSHDRSAYCDISPGLERPSLSEYQVPVSSDYTPRGTTYQITSNHQPTPPKMAYVEDYSPGRFSDPLAAEMSMIDIGPSRGGRTALRPSRGY